MCSQVCSVYLRLYSCPADRFLSIIFLDSVNLCINFGICFSPSDLFHSVAPFHVFISYLTNDFFGEMSVEVFAHFLIGLFIFLILRYMSCLCIWEINPLSVISFAIIFSHSEGCISILFIVYFAVQKQIVSGKSLRELMCDTGSSTQRSVTT